MTKNIYIMKDKIEVVVEANVIKLQSEQNKVMANMILSNLVKYQIG